MARPVLGIICCHRSVEDETAQAVMLRHVTAAIKYADAAALLIPSLPALAGADEVAPRIDGLLLTGSPSNVEAHRYGQEDEKDAPGPFDPDRDRMSHDLIHAMVARGKPVFGICRGFQELNLAFGGTLRRDCATNPALLRHHTPLDVDFNAMFDLVHPVELTPGGWLARGYGRQRLEVNSVHFHGLDRLGDGLAVEARAPDGLVEAISGTIDGATVLAVQWRPEWRVDQNPDGRLYFGMLANALRGKPPTP